MTEHCPVGLGVLGVRSHVANTAMLPAIEASAHAEVAAVAAHDGPVPERWFHVDAGGYDDVIDHPDVAAVYIALPNGMHREWAQRCAAAGKHVLCELPLGVDTADAAAMASVCDEAGVVLADAWVTPFDARWSTAIDRVRSAELGDVIDIDAAFNATVGAPAGGDGRRPDHGTGALIELGVYCLGPIVELWGPNPVVVDATSLWHESGVDARTEAVLEWPDGRQGRIRCSFVDPPEQRLEFVGTDGSLVLERDAHSATHTDAHTGTPATRDIVVATVDGRVTSSRVDPGDPYVGMVDAFARAVRGDAPWPRPMSATLQLLALLERIGAASR